MAKKKELPIGHDLVVLARKFSDEKDKKNGSDALGFDYAVFCQKDFMEMVRWLKENGY
jgi:hypothetical protein